MRGVWLVAAVAATCGGVFAPADPAGVAREAPRPSPVTGPYAEDLRTRRTFGLSTDEAFVASLHAAYRAGDRTSGFGIPMSREEVAELAERQEASAAISPVAKEWAARQPLGVYGGMFVDHLGGGFFTVLVTRDVERARRELLALVSRPDRLRVREAKHSRDYLGWVQARVAEYGFGHGVTGSSVDERRNLVEVSTTDVEWARHALPLIVPVDVIEVTYSQGIVPA